MLLNLVILKNVPQDPVSHFLAFLYESNQYNTGDLKKFFVVVKVACFVLFIKLLMISNNLPFVFVLIFLSVCQDLTFENEIPKQEEFAPKSCNIYYW